MTTVFDPITVQGVPAGALPLALAERLAGAGTLIHVAENDRAMDALAAALPFFTDAEIIRFPAWDCMPYDRVSPRAALVAERVQVLALLAQVPDDRGRRIDDGKFTPASNIQHPASGSGAKRLILTTAAAIVQKLPPVAMMRAATLKIQPGAQMRRERLLEFLNANGYRRAGKAIAPGEYALRGSIVDIVLVSSPSLPQAASPPSPPQAGGLKENSPRLRGDLGGKPLAGGRGEPEGLRLDFFGDELEQLRRFDPMTQLTQGQAEALALHPAGELPLSEERIAQFRAAYRERFGAVSREDPLYESVSAGQHYPGVEHWLPLFFDSLDTLADYAPDAAMSFDAEAAQAVAERQETIRDYYQARVSAQTAKNAGAPYHPLPPEELYVLEPEWETLCRARRRITFSPFLSPSPLQAEGEGLRPTPNFAALRAGTELNPFDQLAEYAAEKRAQGKATLLAALSPGSADRLAHLLQAKRMHAVQVAHWQEAKNVSGKSIGVCVLPLAHGFEAEQAAIVTEQDVLGERIIRAKAKKKNTEVFLAEAAAFQEGELVVHREHGIGRFESLETLEVSGAKHDCLKLTYADDDRLFLPVENIELITRFGAEDEGVKLDKLGTASWQARKARMKERITLAAGALLKTAAERLLKHAPVLEAPGEKYDAFCARFDYVETEDQARSIEEVLEDLEAGRPMDRLICGDVGFGKTEVALRAAFTAVNAAEAGGQRLDDGEDSLTSDIQPLTSGAARRHQVALIVPTTLLARQHYRNFVQRFEGFGVRVAQLSRMVNAAGQKKVREGLADGSVDIVIGTHALLAKSISFHRLGLLIVDEEQHFGVAQKEKLKALKSDVHVLTLSATPIPRTLQLALTGVRSLSLITTPPMDRLAVRSFVMPFDPLVIREAILRERHRGGRVFVVCPRIKDIAEMKEKLLSLVPEAKLAVAHGQMTPAELDEIMTDFYEGKYDLLLSTAIVESGLDIPQANTIIVHRADRFGLGQLYQLRGRVGRGKTRAYAYFLLPHGKTLTRDATRRLEVMQSLDTLGAGFQLASHDMDIRGFGNLVGEEQSGHVREVGIELYQQMLEEAVAALRGAHNADAQHPASSAPADFSPVINLGLSVLIPEAYVEDLNLRMGLYRRAGLLAGEEELNAFAAELVDRFGPLPEEVRHLLDTVRVKQLCKEAGIARVDAGPKGAVIGFHQDRFDRPEALLAYIAKHPTALKLRPDQKLVYMREWKDNPAKMRDIAGLLEEIGQLIPSPMRRVGEGMP